MKTSLAKNGLKLKSIIFALMLFTCITTTLKASHVVGGEITYSWVSGNTYNVSLTYYSDCAGIPNPTTVIINYESSSCVMSGSSTLPIVSGPTDISPICPASLPNSSCNGGVLYAVRRVVYSGQITLPGACNDWTFSYNECCRNGAITNLQNGAGSGSYFEATLNNLDVPFNNSAQFGGIPVNMLANNLTTSLSWNTYDVDGDSVYYELVAPRDYISGAPMPIAYNLGFSPTQPFASSSPTTLDQQTGVMTISPNALQVAVVTMRISEFRNGLNIGNVYRDYQFAVVNTTNNLPSLTGINGTATFVTNGCPGTPITFDVYSSDADATQNLSIDMNSNGTAASFTTTVAQFPTGTFTWTPSTSDISSQPYIFNLDVKDDNCDYFGTQTFTYHVYVNGCNTNDVWPGDANSDGAANLYDLLAVGLAYNDNGPVRPSATLNWVAEPCTNWANNFISGINHKHADTDGNGTVNIADTTAIMLNYGLNHPLRNGNPYSSAVADLSIIANADTIGTSTSIDLDIAITSPVDSLYGLAFRLYLSPALVDLTTLQTSYTGSIFGTNGVDMIQIDRHSGLNGIIDIALTRKDQTNISGSGPVGRVTIVTTDNVSGKVMLDVAPFDIVGVSASGQTIAFNPIGDAVIIDPNFTGVSEHNLSEQFSVYPSPASDYCFVAYNGSESLTSIEVQDLDGKTIIKMNAPQRKQMVDIRTLAKGVYLVRVTKGDQTAIQKLVKH